MRSYRWFFKRRNGRRVLVRRPVKVSVPVECAGYRGVLTALGTLAHEAMHVKGVRPEAEAECYALQLVAIVATQFGAAAGFASEMTRDYLSVYHDFVALSPIYGSAQCRDGGRFDLNPGRSGWPLPASP